MNEKRCIICTKILTSKEEYNKLPVEHIEYNLDGTIKFDIFKLESFCNNCYKEYESSFENYINTLNQEKLNRIRKTICIKCNKFICKYNCPYSPEYLTQARIKYKNNCIKQT